ncbi:MAG: type II secretion system F family protein [Thermoplasmatota archaeon]
MKMDSLLEDRFARSIGIPAGLAFLAGVVAASTGGLLRALVLMVLFAAGLGLTWVVTRAGKQMDSDEVLGGAGYDPKVPGGVKALHAIITILYTMGLMVVVFAALVRFGLVPTQLNEGLVQAFPFVLGLYVVLLAAAAAWKANTGAFVRTWYTRFHGGALIVGAVLVYLGALFYFVGVAIQANDLPVLVLIGLLGVGTQMMLTTGLPTTFDLLSQIVRAVRVGTKETSKSTPPIVYAAVLAFLVAGVVSFLGWRLQLLERVGGFGDQRTVYLIALVPVALAVFFAISAYAVWREGRRGIYKRKITTKLRNDLIVYAGSAAAGATSAFILIQLLTKGSSSFLGIAIPESAAQDFIAITILVTTGPIGYYLHKQHQRTEHIEVRMPDLLNDLAEARRAGLTLPAALRAATRADYGALSTEVKKMADQVAWGVSFNEALRQFGERVKTPLVQRSTNLVIEASRTGGSVAQILKAAARDVQELKAIEQDRKVTMMTYLIVIYVVFFVFLVVLGALDTQFIPEIVGASEKIQNSDIGAGSSQFGSVDPEGIKFAYFNAAMVQGIGNGLVGGVLSEGRVTAGFRHVAIMVFLAWVVFRLLLGL